MTRPCFLVVDREYPGSISTRKLVIETAKMNVLTAYSGVEAIEMLGRFAGVDGAVIDAGTEDISCLELVRRFKKMSPKLPVIVISAPGFDECPDADFQLESFEPAKLLGILKELRPGASAEIERHEEDLSREHAKS